MSFQKKEEDYALRKPNMYKLSTSEVFKLCELQFKNDDECLHIADYLNENIRYFKIVNRLILPKVASVLEGEAYLEGDTIIRQGERGDCMYIIYRGSVNVYVNDRKVASLETNAAFGDDALIKKKAYRNATIIARSSCQLLFITKENYDKVLYVSFLSAHILRTRRK